MRLIPAEAGKFRQGQVYVAGDNIQFMHLDRFEDGLWVDDSGGIAEEDLVNHRWYLIDPSDDPSPEPKRDEFWEKCYLAVLTSLSANPDLTEWTAENIAESAAQQADACVAERKARS